MGLTNTGITKAKAKKKAYKLSDAAGLYLFVHPSGSKTWRMKYRFDGKERVLTIGKYSTNPDIGYSLADARIERDKAKKLLKDGIDPSSEKRRRLLEKGKNQANTFELVAREWWQKRKAGWTENHANSVIKTLEQNIFPKLGSLPIVDITPNELLHVIRIIEKRGALEMASKVLQRCSAVYRYAIANNKAQYNPAADLRDALETPKQKNHASLKANELPEFLQRLSSYDGSIQTKLATKLLVLTFVRTTELRGAKWNEFVLKKKEWVIPAERMKMKKDHVVPLSTQAVAILEQLKSISGHRELVFPSQQNANKPISENTILYALYRLGYHSRATGHGFRTTASTILNETGFNPDAIERQLAHVPQNKIRGAYNKALYMPERRKMMQWWADHLDCLETGSNVVVAPFGAA